MRALNDKPIGMNIREYCKRSITKHSVSTPRHCGHPFLCTIEYTHSHNRRIFLNQSIVRFLTEQCLRVHKHTHHNPFIILHC